MVTRCSCAPGGKAPTLQRGEGMPTSSPDDLRSPLSRRGPSTEPHGLSNTSATCPQPFFAPLPEATPQPEDP